MKNATIDLVIAFDKWKEKTGLQKITVKNENRILIFEEKRC